MIVLTGSRGITRANNACLHIHKRYLLPFMFSKDIETLLQKSLGDLPLLIGGRSLRHDIDDLAAMALPASRLAVVDDASTALALGNHVFKALKSRFAVTHITLADGITASRRAADDIQQRASGCDAYVAVGSGSINDLCKYVSHREGKPYIVFPTAASMNGYASANASISEEGFKHSMPAHLPKAVFCDYAVIAAAPARLSISGLGDSIARPTAQSDWLLSHLLLGTAYSEAPFELLSSLEPHVFEQARGVASGDTASIELLLQLLLLSGFGMTMAGGSYPASQGEHMIAHAYEMLPHKKMGQHKTPHRTLHGEEIAVTALAMAQRQSERLRRPPALQPRRFPQDRIAQHFGIIIAGEAKTAYHVKSERMEAASLSDDMLKARWDEIADILEKVMLPPAQMQAILKAAGASVHPEDLQWQPEDYALATGCARFLRDRFTFLDMA